MSRNHLSDAEVAEFSKFHKTHRTAEGTIRFQWESASYVGVLFNGEETECINIWNDARGETEVMSKDDFVKVCAAWLRDPENRENFAAHFDAARRAKH